MAAELKERCYEGDIVQNFQFCLEQTQQHKTIIQSFHNILPGEFKRIGAGKSSLDVLGVGSGGGEMDAEILTTLQSTFPGVPITTDIVEGCSELTDNFKALVAKTPNLQKIKFAWHLMTSEEYERQAKAKGDMKRFDFIHMVHMIYYVNDLAHAIKFHHSLLKDNGRLMIILGAANNGWDILWKTYKKELSVDFIREYRSSAEVTACLKTLGLKYEEHIIPYSFDISESFNPSSPTGVRLLSFMTTKDNFYQSFTPEVRAGILDLLRSNKCSTEKDGRVYLDISFSCIIVYA